MDEIPGTCLICKKQTDDATDGYVNDTGDLQGVCDSCRADAALGRAVRKMTSGMRLATVAGDWTVHHDGMTGMVGWHTKPESALEEIARLMKGEGE